MLRGVPLRRVSSNLALTYLIFVVLEGGIVPASGRAIGPR